MRQQEDHLKVPLQDPQQMQNLIGLSCQNSPHNYKQVIAAIGLSLTKGRPHRPAEMSRNKEEKLCSVPSKSHSFYGFYFLFLNDF